MDDGIWFIKQYLCNIQTVTFGKEMFPPQARSTDDSAIRETDNDAALARLSAVQKRYLEDPYIRFLVPRAHLAPPRSPLINIGTYVRSSALDALIHQWIQCSERTGQECQIVSLGAGSDTRFWRIMASELLLQENLMNSVLR